MVSTQHFASPDIRERMSASGYGSTAREAVIACATSAHRTGGDPFTGLACNLTPKILFHGGEEKHLSGLPSAL